MARELVLDTEYMRMSTCGDNELIVWYDQAGSFDCEGCALRCHWGFPSGAVDWWYKYKDELTVVPVQLGLFDLVDVDKSCDSPANPYSGIDTPPISGP